MFGLKKLLSDSVIYGLSSVLTRFISLLLIPFYTSVFLPEDYAVINLVGVAFNLIAIFVVFGLDNSVAIWFWQDESDSARKKIFSSWAWFQFFLSMFFCLIGILFAAQFSNLILSSNSYVLIIILSCINLPLSATQRTIQNWYRYQNKPIPAVIFSSIISVMTILLNIVLVLYLNMGVSAVFWSQLITSILGFIYYLIAMRGWYDYRDIHLGKLRDMLIFALPLIPATISYWLLGSAGSFFLEKLTTKEEVGLFQIGLSFAGIVQIVIMAFNQAWPPFAISIAKNENHREVYSKVYLLYILFGALLTTLLCIFSKEILEAFTQPAYYDAAFVICILAFNVFVSGITGIITIGSNLAKNNKPYGFAVVIGSIITVVLYSILIPYFGKEGSAFATLLGNIFVIIYTAIKVQKLYYVPYQWNKSLYFILIGIVAIVLCRYWQDLISKICIVLVYLVIYITIIRRYVKLILYSK